MTFGDLWLGLGLGLSQGPLRFLLNFISKSFNLRLSEDPELDKSLKYKIIPIYVNSDCNLVFHPPQCFLTNLNLDLYRDQGSSDSRVSLFMSPAVVSLPRLQLRGLNLGSQQNWTKLEEIGTNWA